MIATMAVEEAVAARSSIALQSPPARRPQLVSTAETSARGATLSTSEAVSLVVQADREAVCVPRKIAEAIQGVDQNGDAFFLGVTATGAACQPMFRYQSEAPFGVSRVQASPVPTTTSEIVAASMLAHHGIDPGRAGAVTISSLLKAGGGEASSSSDATGTVLRYALAHGIPLPLTELYERLCAVERSDLLLCPEFLVRCYPEAGRFDILRSMYPGIALRWDTETDKAVCTSGARAMDLWRRPFGAKYDALVEMAIQSADGFCKAATDSACMNDQLLPKPGFSAARRLADTHGCAVLCSHTGTFLALWMPAAHGRPDFGLAAHLRGRICADLGVPEVELFLTGGVQA